MGGLSQADVSKFEKDGFLCPIDVCDADEALALRRQLEEAEREAANDPRLRDAIKSGGSQVLPFIDRLSRDPRITDPLASLLGPDLLLWASSLFIKEPHTSAFISWHQDVHYWGLDDASEVTAWLALSPATVESGCMRFVAGSHKTTVPHNDTFATDNMLSRGQEIAVQVDESTTVNAELRPGQMSLHHGLTFHASHENRSDDRRIGLAFRYVPTRNRQVGDVKTQASLVRGTDTYGHFELTPPPTSRFEREALARFERGRELSRAILSRGAKAPARL